MLKDWGFRGKTTAGWQVITIAMLLLLSISAAALDSDGDWLPDDFELTIGTDPFNPDSDGDGISDFAEGLAGMNPASAADFHGDVDGDAVSNGDEWLMGTKIASALSFPQKFGDFAESFESAQTAPGLRISTRGTGFSRHCGPAAMADSGLCFYQSNPTTSNNTVSELVFTHYDDAGVFALSYAWYTPGSMHIYVDDQLILTEKGWSAYRSIGIELGPGAHTIRVVHDSPAGGGFVLVDNVTFERHIYDIDSEILAVEVLASHPVLATDQTGANAAVITARVVDLNTNGVANVPVVFAASDGALIIENTTTDSTGIARAQLNSGGNPANRDIAVSVNAGYALEFADSVDVRLRGTEFSTLLPFARELGDSFNMSLLLRDSNGAPVAFTPVLTSSQLGNIVSLNPAETDEGGLAHLAVTATATGNDTITVAAPQMNATTGFQLSVFDDLFVFLNPTDGANLAVNTTHPLQLIWKQGGQPVVGQRVNFSTDFGNLTSAFTYTDANGTASVGIVPGTYGGTATVLASAVYEADGTAREREVQFNFVGAVPALLDLRLGDTVVSTNESTDITARLFDIFGNPVPEIPLSFALYDTGGGSLSAPGGVTNQGGEIAINYTAGDYGSGVDGVRITASAEPGYPLTEHRYLTVYEPDIQVSLGTGNTVFEPATTIYAREWVVFATDALRNPMANVAVEISANSKRYRKGHYSLPDPITEPFLSGWQQRTAVVCANEDLNDNDFLEPGEDLNSNGRLDPGRQVVVAPAIGTFEDPCPITGLGANHTTTVSTNANGIARFCVFYAQNDAGWIELEMTASASVTPSASDEDNFVSWLPAAASDIANIDMSPPNLYSPFGDAADCTNPD